MAVLVIVVGSIATIGWLTMDGTVPLVISIVAGSLIAIRGVLEAEDEDSS